MGGALMQLVAFGAQDVYLTGNAQITFFKNVYRRHTNFSMESIEQYYNGSVNFGRRGQCTLSRNGDLAGRVYSRSVLPEVVYSGEFTRKGYVQFGWVRRLGHAMHEEVELEVVFTSAQQADCIQSIGPERSLTACGIRVSDGDGSSRPSS